MLPKIEKLKKPVDYYNMAKQVDFNTAFADLLKASQFAANIKPDSDLKSSCYIKGISSCENNGRRRRRHPREQSPLKRI